MGYGFMVWAVDTVKLRQVAGSKDEKLRRMIGGRFKRDLAELDDLFSHSISAGGPNTYEALRQIIDGTVPDGGRNGIYYYAFRLLVEHFGKFQDNGAVMPWNSPDFDPVNAALAAMGVPLKMDRFYGSDLPVNLPWPDDFPSTGWVDEGEAQKIHAAFSGATSRGDDPEAERIVECVRGWFRNAASLGRGLVSYYH